MHKTKYLKNSFLFALFLFTTYKTEAQVVYTDVNPDVTINTFQQGYQVDFNNDGKIDVHLVLLNNVGVWTMLLIPDANTDHTYVVVDNDEASILEAGDEISATSDFWRLGSGWGGLLYGYWNDSGEYGHWTGRRENKYIGIKFQINGQYHYGWLYVTTEVFSHSSMQFTMQAFAYNATTEAPITAGDLSAIQDISKKEIQIYPNPAQNQINLQTDENIQKLNIYDMSGKLVLTQTHLSSGNSVDISGLGKGLYLIKILGNQKITSVKLVKQ